MANKGHILPTTTERYGTAVTESPRQRDAAGKSTTHFKSKAVNQTVHGQQRPLACFSRMMLPAQYRAAKARVKPTVTDTHRRHKSAVLTEFPGL